VGKTQIKNHRPRFLFKVRGTTISLGEHTKIMGVINITPDSFSRDGLLSKSKQNAIGQAVSLAKEMIEHHADILDIGGESSRPGAAPISIDEEISRVIPIIQALRKHFKIPLSIDTYKNEVAKEALKAGACIVNNIMGTQLDKELLKTVKKFDAGIILMHMKGQPSTMQNNVSYKHLIPEILKALKRSLEICLEMGIKSDRICIDPGIGFAKTPVHNLEIIHRLKEFQVLNVPILIGTSRKSFIGKILSKDINQRAVGTLATTVLSAYNGAHIVRVHDVKETFDAIQTTDAVLNQKI
jgi:dihydropteroate synthase